MVGGWSGRALLKYTLLQIPGLIALVLILLLAKRWVDLPVWLNISILTLWIVKDAVLFPFVWRAYDKEQPGDPLSMIGQRAIAQERLNPNGYASVRGELWKVEIAEGEPPVEEGTVLRVKEMQGLKLVVERARG
jgi:membrane protein implicated in regulation of membrane protease activity